MKDKLLWSWSSREQGEAAHQAAYPVWGTSLAFAILMAILVFLIFKALAPVIGAWALIPLVFILPNLFILKRSRQMLDERSYENDFYIRFYTDGIDINARDARGFYEADDISLETLEVDTGSVGYGPAGHDGPVLRFDTIKPAMTVETVLTMDRKTLQQLEAFVDSLKSAND